MLLYNNKLFTKPNPITGNLITLGNTDVDRIDPLFGNVVVTNLLYASKSYNDNLLKELKRDSKNFANGLSIPKTITMLNIKHLNSREKGLSPYNLHTDEEKKLMKASLERLGVLHPFIVLELDTNYYMIVDGENRLNALKEMFNETNNEKYETVPCIILPYDDFSHIDIRDICINSNLNRKCDHIVTTKIVLMMAGIIRSRNRRLKDVNVAREISGRLNISINTVYNYLMLENLSITSQSLLNTCKISLSSARKLCKLDRELQELLLEEIGLDRVSDHFIKGTCSKYTTKQTYKRFVQNVLERRHPYKYKIQLVGEYEKIEIVEKMLESYLQSNFEIRRVVKMKVKNKYFDFTSGLDCFGEREVRIPEFFQKFIENGEVGTVIDDDIPSLRKEKNIKTYVTRSKIILPPGTKKIPPEN